jgi:hypothetical protein
MANLQDVIERMKAEGDLTRNSGTNSLKQTNRILGEVKTELVEIGKSLGAIRTVGGLGGGGQTIQVVGGAGGAGGTASAATAPVSGGENNDPQTVMGLLGAAIRNQTLGRVERGAEAAKELAAQKFRESFAGRGIAATQQFVGEKVEGTKEGLRGLAGIQTNKERDDLLRKSAEEEAATRESIEQLVEIQTRFLGLSEDEAQNLRNKELEKADLGSGGSAVPTATMIGAGATGAAGGGGSGGGGSGGGGKSGDGAGKMGGIIGKFFGGLAGGALAGFVMALGNPAMIKAAGIFALVLPLIGVGLAGFIAVLGLGFAAAAAAIGKGLEVLNDPLDNFSYVMGNFEMLDGQAIGEAGMGMGTFFSELPLLKIAATAVVLDKLDLNGLGKFADAMKDFEKTDGQKLSVASTGIGNFFDNLPGLGDLLSGLAAGKVSGSLGALADALVKFNEVNADKLKTIGPAVGQLGEGLLAAGLGEVFSTISKALGGEGGGIEGQMTSLANGFRQFSDINADDVAKIGPAVKNLGEGLKAAGDSGGFGNALGGIVSSIGSFFGAEEKDPIEMFKKFAVLGEGETGDSLKRAGEAVGGLGKGLASINNLDMGNLDDFVDDILPPLMKLSSSFNSPEMAGDPLGKFSAGLVKLGELEKVNGTEVQANLTNIGKGLSSFAEDLEDGKIKTLQKAAFILRMIFGQSGGGGAATGGRTGGRAGGARGIFGGPGGADLSYLRGETRSEDLEGSTPRRRRSSIGRQADAARARMRSQAAELEKRGLKRGTFIAGKFFDAEAGLTDEQAAVLRMKQRMGNELSPEMADALSRYEAGGGRTNGAAINGASREIAAGQRQGGGNIVAPTDNSNNSTNVTNVNNGGGGSPPPSPRRSQHRGGMYDRPRLY